MKRERFSPSICTRANMEKPASPQRFRFVQLYVRGLFVEDGVDYENSGRMLKNSIRNQTSTYHSVTVLLTLSNLEIQATRLRFENFHRSTINFFTPLSIPFARDIQANPCLSWTPTTNQSWIDAHAHVHDFKRFPFAKKRNRGLYLNNVAREMRPGSLGS